MGNWCTATHWFECSQPGDARAVIGGLRSAGRQHRWLDESRWALRAGMLSPTLVQAESVTKYGVDTGFVEAALRNARGVRVAELCIGEDFIVGPTEGSGFRLAWNYVASPASHDLAAVAATLGGGAVSVAGERRVLCLPEAAPLRLVQEPLRTIVERDDALGRLVYALVVSDHGVLGRSSRHLLGLYTPAHGWVHLATLVLGLHDRHWEHTGSVWLENGADHNPVIHEFADGPHSSSIYIHDTRPVTLSRVRWPLP